MRKVRYVCLALACICLLSQAIPAMAAEVECDATYCFSAGDFTEGEEPLAGICITGLPAGNTGTVIGSASAPTASATASARRLVLPVFV